MQSAKFLRKSYIKPKLTLLQSVHQCNNNNDNSSRPPSLVQPVSKTHWTTVFSAGTVLSCFLPRHANCLWILSYGVKWCLMVSYDHNESVQHHTLWTGNTRDGQNGLAFHMQVSCRRVWSTMHSGVGG